MRVKEFRQEIERIVGQLAEEQKLLVSNRVVEYPLGGKLTRISWTSNRQSVLHLERANLAEYLEICSRGAYSIRLADYSVIQISGEFKRDRLIKHRYAYISCPLTVLPEDDSLFENIDDYISQLSTRAINEQLCLGAAFRFD